MNEVKNLPMPDAPLGNAGNTMRIEDRTFHCRYCGREFKGSVWQDIVNRMRSNGREPTEFEYCSEACISLYAPA
jgi:hypothetical protein